MHQTAQDAKDVWTQYPAASKAGLCARRARQLTDEQRAAVAAYFSVYRGQEGGLARLALSQVSAANHPALDRAYDLLRPAWVEVGAWRSCPACLCCIGVGGAREKITSCSCACDALERG